MSVQCSTPWPDAANPGSITPQKQRPARRKKLKPPNCVGKLLFGPHQRTIWVQVPTRHAHASAPRVFRERLKALSSKARNSSVYRTQTPYVGAARVKDCLRPRSAKNACHSTFIHQSQCIHTSIDYCSPLLKPAIPQPPHSQHG